MAAVADDGMAALHIKFAGLLEHARRVDRSEFTYDDLGVHAYVNVAFVRDEDAWGAYCNDTGGVDVYDEVWTAARGTAHVELGEEQPPNECEEQTRRARVRLEDVELRGPDGRIMHVDELELSGRLGWYPPSC